MNQQTLLEEYLSIRKELVKENPLLSYTNIDSWEREFRLLQVKDRSEYVELLLQIYPRKDVIDRLYQWLGWLELLRNHFLNTPTKLLTAKEVMTHLTPYLQLHFVDPYPLINDPFWAMIILKELWIELSRPQHLGFLIAFMSRDDHIEIIREYLIKYPEVETPLALEYINILNRYVMDYDFGDHDLFYYLKASRPLIDKVYPYAIDQSNYKSSHWNTRIRSRIVLAHILQHGTLGSVDEYYIQQIPKIYRSFKRFILAKNMEHLWMQQAGTSNWRIKVGEWEIEW